MSIHTDAANLSALPHSRVKLAQQIRELLNGKPQAVSFLHSELSYTWRLGSLDNFEQVCRNLGFHVYAGRTERNQRARLVSAETAPEAVAATPVGFAVAYNHPAYSGTRYLPRFKVRNSGGTSKPEEARVWKTEAGAAAAMAKAVAPATNVRVVKLG